MNLFIIWSIIALIVLFLVLGFTIASQLIIKNYHLDYPIDNKVKLVQISDTHLRKLNEKTFLKVIKTVNRLNPDIVLFSGDLYDHGKVSEDLIKNTIKILSGITCENRIALYGNHDVKSTTLHPYIYTIKEAGFNLVKNETFSLLNINFYAMDSMFNKPYYNIPKKRNLLVLAHEPDTFIFTKASSRVLYQISGHSHGGQIKIPLLTKAKLPEGCELYYKHHYKENGKELFVSYGLGNSRHNVRFFVRKEICVYYIGR